MLDPPWEFKLRFFVPLSRYFSRLRTPRWYHSSFRESARRIATIEIKVRRNKTVRVQHARRSNEDKRDTLGESNSTIFHRISRGRENVNFLRFDLSAGSASGVSLRERVCTHVKVTLRPGGLPYLGSIYPHFSTRCTQSENFRVFTPSR